MLKNKKVYVGKYCREIQEKVFTLGIKWNDGTTDISHLEYPFLFFHEDGKMTCDKNLVHFNDSYSDYEEITAKEILSMEPPRKTIQDLYPLSGFRVMGDSSILKVDNISPYYSHELWNTLPSEKEAEAYKILPMLLHFRDRYNGNWKPNWVNSGIKYTIIVEGVDIIKYSSHNLKKLFAFKTKEIRDKFMEDFKRELNIVKPLL